MSSSVTDTDRRGRVSRADNRVSHQPVRVDKKPDSPRSSARPARLPVHQENRAELILRAQTGRRSVVSTGGAGTDGAPLADRRWLAPLRLRAPAATDDGTR